MIPEIGNFALIVALFLSLFTFITGLDMAALTANQLIRNEQLATNGVQPLNTLYDVTITTNTSADTAATYDMRGFARLSSKRIVRIDGSTRSDSLCLTSSGQIMPRSCTL